MLTVLNVDIKMRNRLGDSRQPTSPSQLAIERNYFTGAVLKALGGKADVYR